MPDPTLSTTSGLLLRMEGAWEPLLSFLEGLTQAQWTDPHDASGWNVRDHVTHLTAWEQSVAVLFRDEQRHVGLGVEPSLYAAASFDEINQVIRDRRHQTPPAEAARELVQAHTELVAAVRTLRDPDLQRPLRDVFARAPADDDRQVVEILWDNTGAHFTEHLAWLRQIVESGR